MQKKWNICIILRTDFSCFLFSLEFSKVMQILDCFSDLHNCRILPASLAFRWLGGYVNTGKVLYCLTAEPPVTATSPLRHFFWPRRPVSASTLILISLSLQSNGHLSATAVATSTRLKSQNNLLLTVSLINDWRKVYTSSNIFLVV